MVLDPSLSPHAIDPIWDLGTIASRHDATNRPITSILSGPRNYRSGSEFKGAESVDTEKFISIKQGRASTELPGRVSPRLYPEDDRLDFDALSGLEEAGFASIKTKAATLPTEGVFLPIVTGYGTVDRAAIDPWRTFATITTQPGFGRELGGQDFGFAF